MQLIYPSILDWQCSRSTRGESKNPPSFLRERKFGRGSAVLHVEFSTDLRHNYGEWCKIGRFRTAVFGIFLFLGSPFGLRCVVPPPPSQHSPPKNSFHLWVRANNFPAPLSPSLPLLLHSSLQHHSYCPRHVEGSVAQAWVGNWFWCWLIHPCVEGDWCRCAEHRALGARHIHDHGSSPAMPQWIPQPGMYHSICSKLTTLSTQLYHTSPDRNHVLCIRSFLIHAH